MNFTSPKRPSSPPLPALPLPSRGSRSSPPRHQSRPSVLAWSSMRLYVNGGQLAPPIRTSSSSYTTRREPDHVHWLCAVQVARPVLATLPESGARLSHDSVAWLLPHQGAATAPMVRTCPPRPLTAAGINGAGGGGTIFLTTATAATTPTDASVADKPRLRHEQLCRGTVTRQSSSRPTTATPQVPTPTLITRLHQRLRRHPPHQPRPLSDATNPGNKTGTVGAGDHRLQHGRDRRHAGTPGPTRATRSRRASTWPPTAPSPAHRPPRTSTTSP